MKKIILICTLAILSLNSFSQTCEEREEKLLTTIGGVSATMLYNTYVLIDVNLKEKKHTLSLTLVSTTDVAFNCKHSLSGPYKSKKGIALTLGTGAPGMQSETPLPFSDPSHLTAKYTLMPKAKTSLTG